MKKQKGGFDGPDSLMLYVLMMCSMFSCIDTNNTVQELREIKSQLSR